VRTALLGVALAVAGCSGTSSVNGAGGDADAVPGESAPEGGHDDAAVDATTTGTPTDGALPETSAADATAEAPDATGTDATGTDATGADANDTDAGIGSPDGSNGTPCSGGSYVGPFAGEYTSHLTGVGIPIPVTGPVNLKLAQAGSEGTTCTLAGESKDCSDVFPVVSGTVTGVNDAVNTGDATAGGFPFFCTMTGALDCDARKLVSGWLQCTYCIGPVADGGFACSLGNGVGGTTGIGGHFAGPVTANYDASTIAFVTGRWNASEALAGNDGGTPGPDGGPPSLYLSDSGLYLGPGDFGGSGSWSATHP
jgi:hypothetical protein